LPSSSLGTDLD